MRTDEPDLRSSSALVLDTTHQSVLYSRKADMAAPIASITKLMTVLVALQHHKLTDVVAVDRRAATVGESSIELQGGEHMTVADLIRGSLIQSANDAADALALSVAPDFPSFARLMNAEAVRLGLDETHFVRPDGLDAPGEYSSAADVTKLARIAMRTRFIRETVDEETATIAGGRTLHTWDDLLSELPSTFGVKTGHTSAAGWCQVAAIHGRGVDVYATLLGSPSRSVRNADLTSLLVWGVAQFRVVPVVEQQRVYAHVRLPYGRAPLALVAAKPLLAVSRVGRPLTETVTAPAAVSLPIRAGTVLGRVEIRQQGRLVGTRDLVAARTIRRPGLARRLGWYAGRTLHHLAHLL
ncbi:MAG: D-alanyl-D-alanine carboxypeptidase [Solirubrobacterales bacterium]|nr:D-alanyl-D-alanine carboxypeptidase [Solirubrobacterales bacterium]